MSLFLKFSLLIKQQQGFVNQQKFLLAVSGGLDSIVLCDLFAKAGLNFVIAHCNFQLRGEESLRDENFVTALASQYGKEVFLTRFETAEYAAKHKLSTQVAARNLRYNWFRQLAFKEGRATYIVTAHHADDNIETVVMNFFRGTGIQGLAGMDEHFQKIWRPLLYCRHADIVAYAKEHHLKHVEDSSNASSNYTRNYFRNELLPAIAKVFPSVEENILKNIQRLSEVAQVYQQAINQNKNKLVVADGNEERIPILKLQKMQPVRTILWELIKHKLFTAAQVDEVIKLMDASNGSFVQSATHRIIRNRRWLIITPTGIEEESSIITIEDMQKKVPFVNGQLIIEHNIPAGNISLQNDQDVALLNAGEITYPLLLRKWRQGDYFYPLGMQKKKKLNRFFIDQKLSPTEKEKVWVLESNKRIVWVIGYRIDDRFKIKPSTSAALKVTFKAGK